MAFSKEDKILIKNLQQLKGYTATQTTCDRNTALCTKVHRAVKTVEVRIM